MSDELSLIESLAAPFEESGLKFFAVATATRKDGSKVGKVGTYADTRTYMDRLDEVTGLGGWQTSYRCIDPGVNAVECTLSLLVEGHWVSRADVGYPNDARDVEDASKEAWKAAYSDALKRACVQWGVGRYLYSIELEEEWIKLDDRGRFTETPRVKGPRQALSPTPATARPAPAGVGESATEGLRPYLGPPSSTTSPAPTPTKQQLGLFVKDGKPDYVKYHTYLTGQGIRSGAIRFVVPVADESAGATGRDLTAWLLANPGKTLLDLERLIVQAMRDKEDELKVADGVKNVV